MFACAQLMGLLFHKLIHIFAYSDHEAVQPPSPPSLTHLSSLPPSSSPSLIFPLGLCEVISHFLNKFSVQEVYTKK